MPDDEDDEQSPFELIDSLFCHLPPPLPQPYQPLGEEGSTEETLQGAEFAIEAERIQPRVECPVPTVPIASADLERYCPRGDETAIDFARLLLQRGPFTFASLPSRPFPGDGVYALYYHGDLPFYETIRSQGSELPIYLGCSELRRSLYRRLRSEHLQSILQVDNLEPEDFTFRFLILPSASARHAEGLLIALYHPIWNNSGFGSRYYYEDSRANPVRSYWDARHPCRIGAVRQRPRPLEEVETFFSSQLLDCSRAYQAALRLGLSGGTRPLSPESVNAYPVFSQSPDRSDVG
jgi:hypothetical protein